jgi:hypothetical protein
MLTASTAKPRITPIDRRLLISLHESLSFTHIFSL